MCGSKILALIVCATLLRGVAAGTPGSLCDAAARRAARNTGVPLDILLAITRAETGKHIGGRFIPWPWTINDNGQGQWFASEHDALQAAVGRLSSGDDNFDIGCFQINTRWHGEAFASINAMFDPTTNAGYAARFLTELKQQTGSWNKAIAAYHSRLPKFAAPYLDRVTALRGIAPAEPQTAVRPAATDRTASNLFPLLRSGARGAPGSLVPMQSGLKPLFGPRG